jgi:hypothetical protein
MGEGPVGMQEIVLHIDNDQSGLADIGTHGS